MAIVYLQGAFLPEQEAKIPISDRGFQFGDGAYATVQVKQGAPLFLQTHLEQLTSQCVSFNLQFDPIDLSLVDELIRLNGAYEGIFRLKIYVTGGDAPQMHLPKRQGRVLMTLKRFIPKAIYPLTMGLFSSPYTLCHASFKSLAHLNRYYVMHEAHTQGLDDCVTATEKGVLLEAAFGNLFWVEQNTVYTPDPSLPLYFGVTIRNCLHIAKELGYRIEYVQQTVEQLPVSAVCFRTSSMQGVWPVARIGSKKFVLNKAIQSAFTDSAFTALTQSPLPHHFVGEGLR